MDSEPRTYEKPLSPAEAVRLAAERVLNNPEKKREFMLKHGLIDEDSPLPPNVDPEK